MLLALDLTEVEPQPEMECEPERRRPTRAAARQAAPILTKLVQGEGTEEGEEEEYKEGDSRASHDSDDGSQQGEHSSQATVSAWHGLLTAQ